MISPRVHTYVLVACATLFAMAIVYLAISRHMLLLWGLPVMVPVGLFFLNYPRHLMMVIICMVLSGLRVPGLPGQLELYHVFSALYIAIAIASMAIQKWDASLDRPLKVLTWLFLFNLALVILVRGAGFRMLGDVRWGGVRYVTLGITSMLFLTSGFVWLTARQWKWCIALMLVLSCLPLAAESLFLLSGGRITAHYIFFQFAGITANNIEAFLGGLPGGRLQTAKLAGESLLMLAFGIVTFKPGRRVAGWILVSIALVFVLVSGHRLSLLRCLMFIWLFGLIYFRRSMALYVSASCLTGILMLAVIYVVVPYMPYAVQRSVSFLPGLDIDPLARISAEGTTQWRIDVWRMALSEIPDYLVIGKGYTFAQGAVAELKLSGYDEFMMLWPIATAAYHNGPLSLLIGMGVSGLLVGSALLIRACVRFIRVYLEEWTDPVLRRLYFVIGLMTSVDVLIFFTIYGDVHVSFPAFFVKITLLEGLARHRQSGRA